MSEWTNQPASHEAALNGPWAPALLHRGTKDRAGDQTRLRPNADTIVLGRREIRQVARQFAPRGSLTALFARQKFYETIVRGRKHIRFRSSDNRSACSAYRAMDLDDFAGISLLQDWSNWRTIPLSLSGRLPSRPVSVIDLCCGVGNSTAVLAFYCAPGSVILGLEGNPDFVATAKAQRYQSRNGEIANASFRAQSVLDPFADGDGSLLADESVDWINACGAIGCHFEPRATAILARECGRVLRAGGHAALDSGRAGTRPGDLIRIMRDVGLVYAGRSRSCALDRHWQLCFRKASDSHRVC